MADNRNNGRKRDRIGYVLYGIYVLLLLFSVVLIIRFITIDFFFTPDEKIEKEMTRDVTKVTLQPKRGNILSCDGRVLATSYPVYSFTMDCQVRKDEFSKIKHKDPETQARKRREAEDKWRAKARALCDSLEVLFPGKTAEEYYRDIISRRENGPRNYTISRTAVDQATFKRMKTFPLFDESQYRGGLCYQELDKRVYPFGSLAKRTIGYTRSDKAVKEAQAAADKAGEKIVIRKYVGLEGKYNQELCGEEGTLWLKQTDKGDIRNFDSLYVEAVDGNDIRTTINIDYQEIADQALREKLDDQDDIEGGCLVLMEVKTGAIRAMVNLTRTADGPGNLQEISNMAVGRLGEPGSVFKITTLMTAMEDGYFSSMEDRVPINPGSGTGVVPGYLTPLSYRTPDQHIIDYARDHPGESTFPIIYGVKTSSNYLFRYIAARYYEKNPKEFLGRLYSYRLGEAFDFDIEGLATPSIPDPDSKNWSKYDLTQAAMGYTVKVTPLHMLNFYNSIANKGRMMHPYLVEDIEKGGKVIGKKGPRFLNAAICKPATADSITRALKAVTEEGTATILKKAKCKVAGKTGTALIYGDGGYRADGLRKNQGTFVGFFPADDPQYSVICTVYSKWSTHDFFGGKLPAGAVRILVDKMYDIDPYWQKKIGQ